MAIEKLICNFIGDFKVGDNIARNADALCCLVASNENGIFNKLIVVQAGSILEAALDQIIYRSQNHTKEGVPNISEKDRKAIATKEIERFATLIEIMKKHNLLDGLGPDIYREIDKLREYRNRIHIQLDSKPKDTSRDEYHAFTTEIVDWALALNFRTLKHLIERYPRPMELKELAHEIALPISEATDCTEPPNGPTPAAGSLAPITPFKSAAGERDVHILSLLELLPRRGSPQYR